MNWEMIKNNIANLMVNLFLLFVILCCVCGIVAIFNKNTETTATPIESVIIDSVKYENNKIIIEINNLDSIKNAKVVEIKSLNNDSTLKLFYELIRK